MAFDRFKAALKSDKVLIMPDFSKPMKLETDASDVGMGAVVSCQDENGDWKPASYFSKKFNKSQCNWSAYEKELYAVILAMEHFHEYLCWQPFTLYTDHQPLQWLKDKDGLKGKLWRWAFRLKQFNFTIKYKKGCENGNADALSRCPLDNADSEEDTDAKANQIVNFIRFNGEEVEPIEVIQEIDSSKIELVPEDQIQRLSAELNGVSYSKPGVCTIKLNNNNDYMVQANDKTLNWMINLKLAAIDVDDARPILAEVLSAEQHAIFIQWKHLVVESKLDSWLTQMA